MKSEPVSYIAIDNDGIVIDQCPTDGDVATWMQSHAGHRLLITSTDQALYMLGSHLPEGDDEVMLK